MAEYLKVKVDSETEWLDPVTPGELLLEEFLKPMNITKYRLAKEIGVPAQRIGEIIKGKRSITPDTDLRLCKFFGLSDGYWLRAQAIHDLEITRRQLGEVIVKIEPWTHGKKVVKKP
ncbi:MAG: HigA family addiction module antitoxin [Candidatus Nanopelagicales bacterium]